MKLSVGWNPVFRLTALCLPRFACPVPVMMSVLLLFLYTLWATGTVMRSVRRVDANGQITVDSALQTNLASPGSGSLTKKI